MDKILTVATWNISEGHLARSSKLFDYDQEENLEYFVVQLRKINPEIICLPEINMPNKQDGVTLTSRIAKSLGFDNSHEKPFHHSLFYKDRSLGLGLVSSLNFSVTDVPLDQPDFPLIFENGTPASDHTRWLFVADFESFALATTHNWPMRVFQHSYDSEPGAGYGRYLDKTYLQVLPNNKPLIFAGDLNFNTPETVIPQTINTFKLHEALPQDQPTRNDNNRSDHILYGPGFECIEAKIVPGKGDHYLCYAKLKLQ
ncbi:MAG TPA: endonuclease/exonuclease/phosphatase family protein [Candidatus Saccharimonadales bacterium]|nr:endonuclease/exonuclease/phosphatase family protein [Candidatus Saccharimonadales bacterium]